MGQGESEAHSRVTTPAAAAAARLVRLEELGAAQKARVDDVARECREPLLLGQRPEDCEVLVIVVRLWGGRGGYTRMGATAAGRAHHEGLPHGTTLRAHVLLVVEEERGG